ncbi:MAG: hypothetical protein KDK51_10585, partial [Deltaproteobacteria bacterium]|nr:hypothetical protein [Deltaproteobacteria bacterium]
WVGPATLLLKSKSANKHMIQSQPMIFKVTLREEKKWNIFDVYAQLLEEARVKSALGLGSMIQKQAKWTNLSKQDVSLASNIHFSFDTVAKIKERTGRHFTSVYRYADPEDIERNPIFSHEDKAQLYHPTVRLEDQVEINIASRIETIAKDFLHLAQGTTLETYFYEDPDYDPQFGYQSQITFQKLKTNGVFYNDGVEHYPTVQPFYEMEIFMSSYALEQGNRTIGNLSCNIVAKEFSDRVELKVSGWCAGKEPMQTTITYDVIQGQSNMADAIYQTVLNDHDGLYVLKLMNPKKKKLSFGMATRR